MRGAADAGRRGNVASTLARYIVPVQIPDPLSQLSDDRIRRFAAYWIGKCADGRIPNRTDIDPTEIPWALPFIWICDFLAEGPDFRYRLAGEHINDAFRQSLRGKTMRAIVSPELQEIAIRKYARVIEMPAALHNFGPVYMHRGRSLVGERIVLPLSSGGGDMDMIIGVTLSQLNPVLDGSVDGNRWVDNDYIPLDRFLPR